MRIQTRKDILTKSLAKHLKHALKSNKTEAGDWMFNDDELERVTFWTQDLNGSELLIDAKNLVAVSV